MRARDFMSEGKKGRVPSNAERASGRAIKFMDNGTDRIYNLNQIMKAAGMADGRTTAPVSMDHESFAGKNNMAYPYTEEEYKMMKAAFATVTDSQASDVIRDHRSLEPEDTQTKSPVLTTKRPKFK